MSEDLVDIGPLLSTLEIGVIATLLEPLHPIDEGFSEE